MKVKIEIDNGVFIRFLCIITAFVGVIFATWKLMPVLLILAVSFFLAIALNKPVSALARRLPGHSRVLATAISYVLFITVIGSFLTVAIPPIVNQTVTFINSIPAYVEQLSSQRGVVGDIVNRYGLQDELDSFVAGAESQAGAIAQGVGGNVVAGVSSVLNAFVTTLMVLVLTFLMLIEGPRWQAMLWRSYHNRELRDRHQRLLSRMYRVVSSYVNGQVLVATIASSASALTLLVLSNFASIPTTAVLPLAMVVFFTSLIPMIGATIGAAIVVAVLLFNDIGAALIFLAYFLVYQQIENNVIQPAVQSRTVELSALTVFVAAVMGITLAGLVGGILAIPLAGCLRVLLLDEFEHRRKKHSKDGHAKSAPAGVHAEAK